MSDEVNHPTQVESTTQVEFERFDTNCYLPPSYYSGSRHSSSRGVPFSSNLSVQPCSSNVPYQPAGEHGQPSSYSPTSDSQYNGGTTPSSMEHSLNLPAAPIPPTQGYGAGMDHRQQQQRPVHMAAGNQLHPPLVVQSGRPPNQGDRSIQLVDGPEESNRPARNSLPPQEQQYSQPLHPQEQPNQSRTATTGTGYQPAIQRSAVIGHQSMQLSDNDGRKVFVMYLMIDNGRVDDEGKFSAVQGLAQTLLRMGVHVSSNIFMLDNPPDNWAVWFENEVKSSAIVLCIVTPRFNDKLISGRVQGYAMYNLINMPGSKTTFRAVFIDEEKNLDYVPLFMRGSTSYSLCSSALDTSNEEFASLYAFLTGQNRVEKPAVGRVVKLEPKRSRFGQNPGTRNMRPVHPPSPAPTPTDTTRVEDKANLLYSIYQTNTMPVRQLRSHNKMFQQLAKNMVADWETLARMLDVGEPTLYAIKRDNPLSVVEQGVQALQRWLTLKGSRATFGALVVAVYDAGPFHWTLFDVLEKHAPQQ